MALKDIFTMVKVDRYTADGCEVLNKAREADVEDRRYNIGENSEKTGLQKTANGWVKPKKGGNAGAEKAGRNSERINKSWKQSDVISSLPNGWKRVEGATTAPNGYVVVSNNKSRFGGERETKLMKEEDFKKSSTSEGRPSHEQAYLDAFKDEKLKSDVKAAIKKYGATGNNLRNALYKNDKELSDKLEKMQPVFANQFIAEMQRENNNSGATDSAPRVLTGDTRIRVRKA